MKPYYQDSYCTIYNADCLDVWGLDVVPDLVITSPPYNLGKNHHTASKKTGCYDDNMPESEYQEWQQDVLEACFRNTTGDMFYNHQHRIRGGVLIRPDDWITDTEWSERQEIVWNRGSPNMDKCRFFPFTERIYWLTRDVTSTSFKNILNLTDDWHISPVGSQGKHTRQFPLAIPKNIIACCSPSIVLDPFVGGGTTLRACKDAGCKGIGFEKQEWACEIAANRLAQEVLAL